MHDQSYWLKRCKFDRPHLFHYQLIITFWQCNFIDCIWHWVCDKMALLVWYWKSLPRNCHFYSTLARFNGFEYLDLRVTWYIVEINFKNVGYLVLEFFFHPEGIIFSKFFRRIPIICVMKITFMQKNRFRKFEGYLVWRLNASSQIRCFYKQQNNLWLVPVT